ncbi:MAG: AI-2E family transporter [Egibacteraceae bacterium]
MGVLVLLVAAGVVVGQLSLVVIPLVLALFPAALLAPAARLLKRLGAPPALAALVTILGALLVLGAVVALLVPTVAAELPALTESARAGVDDLLQATPGSTRRQSAGGCGPPWAGTSAASCSSPRWTPC